MMPTPIPRVWLDKLSLDQRQPPDFYTSSDQIEPGPYAGPIRTCFADIGLSGVFCVDSAPSIVFLVLDSNQDDTPERINAVHQALWNQGLASLLAVVRGDEVRLYSLNARPETKGKNKHSSKDGRLLDILSLADQALKVKDLVTGIESGRLAALYPDAFDDRGRVDAVLLLNLHAARHRMVESGVSADKAAQLLMQAMFLAYLRDREIIDNKYFFAASNDTQLTDLRDFFTNGNIDAYRSLISRLKTDFNGGMLSAIDTFSWNSSRHAIAEFLKGDVDMETGQLFLFSYDFRYIPVELISEVYDVFLGTDPQQKKATGSFYTPRFLAKLVVDQVWSYIEPDQNLENIGNVIDPACGSGIFLVALFHRYAELHRAQSNGEKIDWDKLVQIVNTLHGLDNNSTAVSIAAFSLSIALLEQVSPPQIIELQKEGKRLPQLLGNTIQKGDFFALSGGKKYLAIIGNPPWGQGAGDSRSGELWAKKKGKPCPNREMAWPFVWKALQHLNPGGVVGYLLPMTSIFFNRRSGEAIKKWVESARIHKLLNLADMRYLLFRDANHASVVAVYSANKSRGAYSFEVWSPKADINLVSARRLLLAPQDKRVVLSEELANNPVETIKMAMWAGNRAKKLFSFFSTLPKLSSFITAHKQAAKKNRNIDWILGQGFQPWSSGINSKYTSTELKDADKYPFVDADEIEYLGMPSKKLNDKYLIEQVAFEGFKDGFTGPHILIREGTGLRFKAVYTEQSHISKNAVKVISVPCAKTDDGKILAAILCSSVSSWILLQSSQVWIARPRFQQNDLFTLPFPKPSDLPDYNKAKETRTRLIAFMDKMIDYEDSCFDVEEACLSNPVSPVDYNSLFAELDELVFEYFGLVQNEINIINESMKYIIPNVQPSRSKLIESYQLSCGTDWKRYCSTIEQELRSWMHAKQIDPVADVIGYSEDLAIVKVSLRENASFDMIYGDDFKQTLESIYKHLPANETRNIQVLRSLTVFDGEDLYLVKPRQIRFWLSEAAMDDADDIASSFIFSSKVGKAIH